MTFSKLMIVEIDMKSVLYTIMIMRKKEFQKEFLFVKFRIKEIDLSIMKSIAPCVKKKVNALIKIGQYKIPPNLSNRTSKKK